MNEIEYQGVRVQFSVGNEFPLPHWEYHRLDRYATVSVWQDRDDDDVTGPVEWTLYFDGKEQSGSWCWELCHAKALAYVALGTPASELPPGWVEEQEAQHAAMMRRASERER